MTTEIMKQILQEVERAQKKYPEWPADVVHAIAVMVEEAGEALRAANNCKWHNGDIEALRTELVQTGAMVIRALKNLDNGGNGEFWG